MQVAQRPCSSRAQKQVLSQPWAPADSPAAGLGPVGVSCDPCTLPPPEGGHSASWVRGVLTGTESLTCLPLGSRYPVTQMGTAPFP